MGNSLWISQVPSTGDSAHFITMKDRKGNRVVLVANHISLKCMLTISYPLSHHMYRLRMNKEIQD